MDATHIHLILTHFPIVGTFIGLLVMIYGLYAKNEEVQKTALAIFILMALFTIPVYLSGEQAEETVEHLPGMSERFIENHEELAEKAVLLMGLLGFVSLLTFMAIVRNFSSLKTLKLITFVVSLATAGLFAKVGNLGGQIRHTEIRANHINQSGGIFSGDESEEHEEHEEHEKHHDID